MSDKRKPLRKKQVKPKAVQSADTTDDKAKSIPPKPTQKPSHK